MQDAPVFLGQYFHRGKVARALGIEEDEIAITGLPCEVISTGLPIHIVPAGFAGGDRGASRLRRREADAIARDLGFGDLFVFTCETVEPRGHGALPHVRAPFRHPRGCRQRRGHRRAGGLPASSTAWSSSAPRVRIVSEQGLEMGRPSRLIVEADVVDGRPRSIQVGGHCVLVGSGRIDLP